MLKGMSSRPVRWLPGGVFILLLLSACAAPLQSSKWREAPPSEFKRAVELVAVPFFPQERYQCGPAALATVLAASGADVTAEQLVPQVYLPQRKGSLQPELLATARRHGHVPYVLTGDLAAVLSEVAAEHPVLVLQNLGLSWAPRWHYAVLVGFDLEQNNVVLRSGTDARHVLPLTLFERTWRRGGAWAMVALPPTQLPATAQELPYLRSVADVEARSDAGVAAAAYQTVIRRWPESVTAWFGLGNSRYAQADYTAAADAYRRALDLSPDYGPVLNNLAHALAQQGKLVDAERYAEAAVAAGKDKTEYLDTLRDIRARLATSH